MNSKYSKYKRDTANKNKFPHNDIMKLPKHLVEAAGGPIAKSKRID